MLDKSPHLYILSKIRSVFLDELRFNRKRNKNAYVTTSELQAIFFNSLNVSVMFL